MCSYSHINVHIQKRVALDFSLSKNDRRDFGFKLIFSFLCPESISEGDFDGLYIGQYY